MSEAKECCYCAEEISDYKVWDKALRGYICKLCEDEIHERFKHQQS